jgi:uncharacterized SAM-binding protein YcdF (DUF218 family)
VFVIKLLRRLISILLLLIVIIPLFVALQIWSTASKSDPKKSDVIVVLGAAQFNGRPTPVLQKRIDEAYRIYAAGLAPIIITVGGGAPGDVSTEAAASYNSLVKKKVPKPNLFKVPIGRDTLTSTLAYIALMKLHHWTSVIIVTDPFHCYRAMAMAKQIGITTSCAPAKSEGKLLSTTGIRYLIRETGAYLAFQTADRVGIHLSDHLKK